jgi:SAM-dependent methyltransferase
MHFPPVAEPEDVPHQALDVGCGRGAALFRLAEAVPERGSVTGIDLSPRMVESTAADVARAGLTWVEVVVGDAMGPDLAPSSFDVISSSLVLFFRRGHRAAAVRRRLPGRAHGHHDGLAPVRDAAHWKRFSMSVGQRQFWDAVPEDRREEVERACFAAVERCRTPDGRLGFDQEIRYTLGRR